MENQAQMQDIRIEKLERLGVQAQKGIEKLGAEVYFSELGAFLKGLDFMRIGQTVSYGQWSAAMMAMRRMGQQMERLEMQSMKKFLPQLCAAIAEKNAMRAKNTLALMVQKRVHLLRIVNDGNENTK